MDFENKKANRFFLVKRLALMDVVLTYIIIYGNIGDDLNVNIVSHNVGVIS